MIRDTVIESRSYRSFDESKKISMEMLLSLVDTARLCPSAINRQPLKYRLVAEQDEVETLISLTKWAAALKDMKFPPDGHHPAAFIVVCCDTTITESVDSCKIDLGIAIQTIMLQACESGLGGCIIGAFNPSEISEKLLIPTIYKPLIVLALGVPDETVMICNVEESGSTSYFRSKGNIHFVPKRVLEDIVIK